MNKLLYSATERQNQAGREYTIAFRWPFCAPGGDLLFSVTVPLALALNRLLKRSLNAQGICLYSVVARFSGGFLGVAAVTKRSAGLRIFKDELQALGVLDRVEIAWWDSDEEMWRCTHPEPRSYQYEEFPASSETLCAEERRLRAISVRARRDFEKAFPDQRRE